MSKVVIDASALLALLYEEPGADLVAEYIPASFISSINLSEVVAKFCIEGIQEETIRSILGSLGLIIVEFDEYQAYQCGFLNVSTKDAGLSLGDRACLSLAKTLSLPALTADKAWTRLKVGVNVKVIR